MKECSYSLFFEVPSRVIQCLICFNRFLYHLCKKSAYDKKIFFSFLKRMQIVSSQEMSKPVFWENKKKETKKIVNLSSAEFAQRVRKVNEDHYHNQLIPIPYCLGFSFLNDVFSRPKTQHINDTFTNTSTQYQQLWEIGTFPGEAKLSKLFWFLPRKGVYSKENHLLPLVIFLYPYCFYFGNLSVAQN